eukprot:1158580-Pelagomonas_calceolata.AAC.19
MGELISTHPQFKPHPFIRVRQAVLLSPCQERFLPRCKASHEMNTPPSARRCRGRFKDRCEESQKA